MKLQKKYFLKKRYLLDNNNSNTNNNNNTLTYLYSFGFP